MIELLDDPENHDGAGPSFDRVLERIATVQQRLEIHMYVWRSDEIGNAVGRAALEAADRGVRVLILKDAGALMYERIEMNRKSFFPEELSAFSRAKYALIGRTFPDSFVEDEHDCSLGAAVMAHRNVTIQRVHHTHSKYYVFDENVLVTGSVNIEDRHRGYRDYMVEIQGEEAVRRFRQRLIGEVPISRSRGLEFLVNAAGRFEIKPVFLDLLGSVRERLYIEMAYIGDPDLSQAIIAASNRGVEVTILFSREANIGNDVNYHALARIWDRCEVQVYLSDEMIHSKLMLFDDEIVVLGSANLSVFSMQKAVELDVIVQEAPEFIGAVTAAVAFRVKQGQRVRDRAELQKYSRPLALLQQLHQKIVG